MDSSDSDSDPSQPEPLPRKPRLPIVCRLKVVHWWLIPAAVLFCGFLFYAPFMPDPQFPSGHNWKLAFLTWSVGSLLALATLWMVCDLLRAEIRGDETGLSWRRGFGGWKSARWDEIIDYHQKFPSSKPWRVVETSSGKLSLDSAFQGIEEIATLVTERAINAPRSGWEVKYLERSQRWPVVLSPWSNEQKWGTPFFTAFIMGTGLSLGGVVLTALLPRRTSLGFWLDVFPLIIAAFMVIPLVVGYVWIFTGMWRSRKFGWKHREETLVLNPEGLIFTSHDKTVEAKWSDVTGVTELPRIKGILPIQVETTQGNFVVWHGTGMDLWQKTRIVLRQYAPHAMASYDSKVRQKSQQFIDLQGEKGAWNGGAIGVGARRWSYQLRDTRFFFACATALSPFVPLFYLILAYMPAIDEDVPPAPSWPVFSVLCLVCALVITMGWLWYRRAEVLADDDGIEVRSFFRRGQRADWNTIEGIGKDAFGEFLKAGKRRIYFVHFFPPVRVKELRETIRKKIDTNDGEMSRL
jgi:hypothetical protein